MSEPVVHVEGLAKRFRAGPRLFGPETSRTALDGVSFALEHREFAALVGESGSGKTTLGRCLLGLLPFDEGRASVNGFDVGTLRRRDQRAFRKAAQMIFQNPYSSLNPGLRVRTILAEAVRVHRRPGGLDAAEEVRRLCRLVALSPDRLAEYPSHLSGGEKRRVGFARALATNPRLIVADEPVSGLDLPIQVQLLELLRHLHARGDTTFLFISHDLRVVRYLATRVLVLYRGRLVEDAPATVFFAGGARHPYSLELLQSAFRPETVLGAGDSWPAIPFTTGGCSFRHRCPRAFVAPTGPCATMPPASARVGQAHTAACHRWDDR